jgi:hypothetical protein
MLTCTAADWLLSISATMTVLKTVVAKTPIPTRVETFIGACGEASEEVE